MQIQAKDLIKTYDQRPVLNGISMQFDEGHSYALTGPSGSGKTTLLHTLSGLIPIDSGSVCLNGTDLWSYSSKQRDEFRNQKMGFIFQFHHLLPEFTAQENIAIPLIIGKVSASEQKRRTMEALEQVGLAHKAKDLPSKLSGGEQQRIAIARAIVNKPELLFADEPTGNLDKATAAECIQLILNLQVENNATCIIATHDLEIAGQLNHHIKLQNGQLC